MSHPISEWTKKELKNEVANLRAQIAELAFLHPGDDTKRMDWLESLHVTLPHKWATGRPPMYVKLDRQAVDAARNQGTQ